MSTYSEFQGPATSRTNAAEKSKPAVRVIVWLDRMSCAFIQFPRMIMRRRKLAALTDRQLRDIGVCPSEAGRRRRAAVEPDPNLEGLR
ncbi:DUF1127 domain-containing protein [Oricola thermophila]